MITRPQTLPIRHKLTAYDFEWETRENGSLHITLAGAYDERGYRWYTNLKAFLRAELVPGNCDRRFYAHFGGASDMVFLLRELMKSRDLEIRGLFSSSSAIVVSVKKRSLSWIFIDSFWTMRVGLAKIGEWRGLPKLDVDHTKHIPLGELKTYNERDCRILFEAVSDFQEIVNDKGGELRVTGASTALDLILRRYLKRPIVNSPMVDAYCRPAYVASRVEPFRRTCGKANVYDINSSFPFSMTFELPGKALKSGLRRIPDKGLWVADCDVTVPEQYLPPLPYRSDEGRVFFPTGCFRTRITSEDLLCGDFGINKVHSCMTFEARDDLGDFARELFALRQGNDFSSQTWKIIVNSGYGKFAEHEDKQILLVNPKERPDPLTSHAIADHIYLAEEKVTIEHSHVAFSAFITARSRRILRNDLLLEALKQGRIYYGDTDSGIVDATLATSKALGGLKLEAEIDRGEFHGPKIYAYETLEGRSLVKAKGFSRVVSDNKSTKREALTFEDFTKLREGEVVTVERMRRIKELLRAEGENYKPDVVRLKKRLRSPKAKRCFEGDDSRPWDVREIEK